MGIAWDRLFATRVWVERCLMISRDRQSRASCLGPVTVSKISLRTERAFRPCWCSDLEIVLNHEWECGGCLKMERCSSCFWRMALDFWDWIGDVHNSCPPLTSPKYYRYIYHFWTKGVIILIDLRVEVAFCNVLPLNIFFENHLVDSIMTKKEITIQ